MRCKHENADHLMPGALWRPWTETGVTFKAQCEQLRCCDCGAWLSLGPAKDTPETAVEVRAAEIAQDIERMGWTVLRRDSLEFAGWNGDGWSAWEGALLDPKYLAGYLARAIVTHDTEHKP